MQRKRAFFWSIYTHIYSHTFAIVRISWFLILNSKEQNYVDHIHNKTAFDFHYPNGVLHISISNARKRFICDDDGDN